VAKTLIFDFDGTIADTLDVGLDIVRKLSSGISQEKRINITKEDIRKMDVKSFMRSFGIPWYHIPAAIDLARNEIKQHVDNIQIFDGMKSVLESLCQTFSLGILSTNKVENVEQILKNNAIEISIFRFIVGGGSIFGKKKILGRIRRSEKLKKTDMVYIGDEIRDIQAARKFGIEAVAVTWGYNAREVLQAQQPDHLVETPDELAAIFK